MNMSEFREWLYGDITRRQQALRKKATPEQRKHYHERRMAIPSLLFDSEAAEKAYIAIRDMKRFFRNAVEDADLTYDQGGPCTDSESLCKHVRRIESLLAKAEGE